MNDIIGAPEIVVIKGRVFWFSPLNDFECACLEAWVRWRTNGEEQELASERTFAELASNAGAAQLLFQSIKRTEPTSIETLIEFLDGDKVACETVYSEWLRINYSDLADEKPEQKPTRKSKEVSGTIEDVYVVLGKHYPWASPEVVARMTKKQQLVYLEAIDGKNGDGLFFATEEDYQRWKLKNE